MNLNLKQKIILMIVPLALGFIGFAGNRVIETWHVMDERSSYMQMLEVETQMITLLHELEKERGLSAGYLSSKGMKFADRLPQQRQLADQAAADFRASLNTLDGVALPAAWDNNLAKLQGVMALLPQIRNQVTSQQITFNKEIAYYTSISEALAKMVHVAGMTTMSASLRMENMALLNMIESADHSGVIRALLTNVFHHDAITKQQLIMLTSNITEEGLHRETFDGLATDRAKRIVREGITGSVVDKVSRLIALAQSKESGFGVDPVAWFDVQSEKLGMMKQAQEKLIDLAMNDAKNAYQEARTTAMVVVSLMLLLLLVAGVVAYRVSSRILAALDALRLNANAIADGDFTSTITVSETDEIGELQQATERIQNELIAKILTERAEAERVKVTLDQLPANVMIADEDFNIIYMNDSVMKFMQSCREQFRTALPNFNPDTLMGSCIDIFHKDPAHQRRMLAGLTGPYTSADLAMGTLTVRVSVAPVLNAAGERIATAATWEDRTEALKIEQEINEIITRSADGDFSFRIPMEGKTGFYETVGKGLNDLSDIVENGLTDVVGAFQALEAGNLTHRITNDYKGTFDVAKQAANNTAKNMDLMSKEANRITVALDQLPVNIMIADDAFNIVYMNAAVQQFMRRSKTQFRVALPDFDPENLMGSCIDLFHKDPAHQRRLLAGLTAPYTSPDVPMGSLTVRVAVPPVINSEGERIATVATWEDRTEALKIEQEINEIITRSANGDFSFRIPMEGKAGFYEMVGKGLNDLSDIVENGLTDLVIAFEALEAGDLTHRITNEYRGTFDQSKQAANNTAKNMGNIIAEVRGLAAQVANSSSEISDGNATLSDRTNEQASALEETAASLEEMTGTIKQSADNANSVNKLATFAQENADKGVSVVQDTIEAMAQITSSSDKIADIIGVIDEIAFQTNLLALNAAVEAARAGDAGRGFAVVAGEVRTLAGRSAEAAKQIKDLIKSSVDSVQNGSKLVDASGEALQEIMQSISKVGELINEIAAAGNEQAAGIEQVNNAVAAMDDVVQQNAALVEQTAVASGHLNELAEDMNSKVEQFKVDENSGAPAEQPRAVVAKPAPSTGTPGSALSVASRKATKKVADEEQEWGEF